MYRTIYSKSSNDRADEFKVITKIQVNEYGCKFARKEPAIQKAQTHIDNLLVNYATLSEKYKETMIEFATVRRENSSVLIEFVEGESFEEHLDNLLYNGNYEDVKCKIVSFFSQIFINEKPFVITNKFKNIFGDVHLSDKERAVDFIDIDILFANVIYKNDKWIVYDYEWFMDMGVPVNYIIYRTLTYYSNNKARDEIANDIFSQYGISESDKETYRLMEENFQKYIYGDTTPMWKLYNTIHGRVVDVKPISDRYVRKHLFQVYYDYGDGYSERNSNKLPVLEYEPYTYRVNIALPKDIQKLRIDPAWSMCIVEIKNICDDNGNKLEYTTNGEAYNGKILFFHEDPQIEVKPVPVSSSFVLVDIGISIIDCENDIWAGEVAQYINNCIAERRILIDKTNSDDKIINDLVELRDGLLGIIDTLRSEKAILDSEVINMKHTLEQMEEEFAVTRNELSSTKNMNATLQYNLESIYSSRSWKITKPLRKLKNIFNKR